MVTSKDTIRLNSGYDIPVLGLGTYQIDEGRYDDVIMHSLRVGCRLIDTAWAYENEKLIGNALAEVYKQKIVKREELFISSKVWCSFLNPKDVRKSLMDSLEWLQTDYLDMLLIHWPTGIVKSDKILPLPHDEFGNCLCTDDDYVETWKAMEELQREGLVRSIGVSNFNEYQINRIINEANVLPAVHQFESHPYFIQERNVQFCKQNNITPVIYAPLGSPAIARASGKRFVLEDPVLQKVAKTHNKLASQIALRFQLQRGVVILSKSSHKERITSNFQIFDFVLSEGEMNEIRKLNKNERIFTFKEVKNFSKYWPFRENYDETDNFRRDQEEHDEEK